MTIRSKTLLTVGLTLVCAIAVLYLSLSSILMRGFAAAEEQEASQNVQRVLNAFENEIAQISFMATDWAVWDDAYAFVLDGNSRFVENTLNASTIQRLDMNIVLFIRNDGQMTWGTGHDLVTSQPAPIPDSFLQRLTAGGPLLGGEGGSEVVDGVLVLPEGVLLVASRPILDSHAQGPSHGTLIFGHFLSEQDVADLSRSTEFPLVVHALDGGGLPVDFSEMRPMLAGDPPIALAPRTADQMAGYALVNDISGEPALMLRVDMPREIYSTARVSLRYLVLALAAVGLALVTATIVLLERMVLVRVAHLSHSVAAIGSKGDLSARVSLPGVDELAGLASTINRTLQDLQDSLNREEALQRQVEELRIEIDEVKKARQVAEIVDTDYFQNLARQADAMRRRIKGSTAEQKAGGA